MNDMRSSTGQTAQDPERRVIQIGGAEAVDFLQSILTSDMEALSPGEIRASALLTPQGRILADIMVSRVEGGFMLDCDASRADDLFARLRRYKLRRPVTLEILDDHQLWVGWNGDAIPQGASTDPRHPALGWRWIGPAGSGPEIASGSRPANIDQWHAVRIAAGVPQGPVDLKPERALMLEAGLDRLGAVDFDKGCYVGQEVTARTHYRGLVKRRIVPLKISGGRPASGEAVSEGKRDLGTVLSVAAGDEEGALCLAAMKLSDIHRINDSNHELTAGGHAARLALPDWMLPLSDPSKTNTG